jgi:hypothetical protein
MTVIALVPTEAATNPTVAPVPYSRPLVVVCVRTAATPAPEDCGYPN